MAVVPVAAGTLQFLVPSVLAPTMAHAAPSIQTQFPLPALGPGQTNPSHLVSGPDGNLWSTGDYADVEKLTTSGTYTTYAAGYQYVPGFENGIAVGPDKNLWFTAAQFLATASSQPIDGIIGRVTPSGTFTPFAVPSASTGCWSPCPSSPYPYGITAGPDGNMWFTERGANAVGVITMSGAMREYPIPTASSNPTGIAAGPDGNMWFTESAAGRIGRITRNGVITEFAIATSSQPSDITAGSNGNLWFTEYGANAIGTMTTSGSGYAEYHIPTASSAVEQITSGPDGALWFTERGANQIGRATTAGVISEYPVALPGPFGIATGPDGNLWYTSSPASAVGSAIGRLPLLPCGDLTQSVTSQNNGTGLRDTPGSPQSVQLSLSNCGVPLLAGASTSTKVTPPPGCGPAPAIPSFTVTLAYGQRTSATSTFADPSCLGTYTVTSQTSMGSSVVATSTSYYVVGNGRGSHIVGDFNGDGYQDLAIGDAYANANAGEVTVYYGGPKGLDTRDPQIFTPTTPGMPSELSTAGSDLAFGFSLATGDFNGDGHSDLAIGVPDYGYPNFSSSQDGGVAVLKGGPAGLGTHGSQFMAAPALAAQSFGISFGWSLASGDFNHDGFDDLSIGAPYAVVGSAQRAGAIAVMYGSAAGLAPSQTVLTESSAAMPGPPAAYGDGFGWSQVAGDFNHDGFADLAIAAPGKAGDLVLYGSRTGLTTSGGQYLEMSRVPWNFGDLM